MELAKQVTYKYIGKDPMKKWYIAKQEIAWLNRYYTVESEFWTELTSLSDDFVEDEPETRELLYL